MVRNDRFSAVGRDVLRGPHVHRTMRMTESPGAGSGRDPRRSRSRASLGNYPKADMGPASPDRGFVGFPNGDIRLPLPSADRDEYVVEAVEIAGLKAEQWVVPFRRGRTGQGRAGRAMVEVVFFDQATFDCFLRVQALRRSQVLDAWLLVRRWARTDDDVDLDEVMCGIVAGSINKAFPGLLAASVIALLN